MILKEDIEWGSEVISMKPLNEECFSNLNFNED